MGKNKQKSKAKSIQDNRPYANCLNCGSELKGMYCHVCGQEATSKTPTIAGFVKEYLNNAFIWDSRFFQTLSTLICRPGHLTNEYLSGKFVSQEHPLKLNMFLLFTFITLFALFSGSEMKDSVHNLTSDDRVYNGIQFQFLMDDDEYARKMNESPRDTILLIAPLFLADEFPETLKNIKTIEDTEGKELDRWTAVLPHVLIEDKIIITDNDGYYRFNPEANLGKQEIEMLNSLWTEMVNFTTKYFPMIILLTAPFISTSLGLVQRKNRLPRIHHFIFALHYIAFLEFLMMCIYILHLIAAPPIEVMEYTMTIGSCAYLTIAFHRVYGTDSWIKAFIKAIFTSFLYLIIILLVFVAIFIISCCTIANLY